MNHLNNEIREKGVFTITYTDKLNQITTFIGRKKLGDNTTKDAIPRKKLVIC
jgi:hypothetical protein